MWLDKNNMIFNELEGKTIKKNLQYDTRYLNKSYFLKNMCGRKVLHGGDFPIYRHHKLQFGCLGQLASEPDLYETEL